MKKMISAAIVVALATIVLSTPAMAFEASADAYVGIYSKYLWRGFDLTKMSDKDDHSVVQPGVDVSIGNFTASFWSNIGTHSGEMNEVDLTLDYSTDIGDLVSISVGNIMYNVDGAADTNELYGGITLNTILEPTLTVYYDYDEFGTVYTTFGVSHGIDLNDKVSLSLGATASYLADDKDDGFGTNDEWFHNAEFSAGLDYAINENITIGASALYSTPLSDDAKDNTGIDDEFTIGTAITYAF